MYVYDIYICMPGDFPITSACIKRVHVLPETEHFPLSAWIMKGLDYQYVNMWVVIGMKECLWLCVARYSTARIKFIKTILFLMRFERRQILKTQPFQTKFPHRVHVWYIYLLYIYLHLS